MATADEVIADGRFNDIWSAMTSGISESAGLWLRLTDGLETLMHEIALVPIADHDVTIDNGNLTLPPPPATTTAPQSATSTSVAQSTRTRLLSPDDRLFLLDVIKRHEQGRIDGASVTIERFKVRIVLSLVQKQNNKITG